MAKKRSERLQTHTSRPTPQRSSSLERSPQRVGVTQPALGGRQIEFRRVDPGSSEMCCTGSWTLTDSICAHWNFSMEARSTRRMLGEVCGGALWQAPSPPRPRLRTTLGMMLRSALVLRGRTRAGLTLGRMLESVHEPRPHWYLAILGTEPAASICGVAIRVEFDEGRSIRPVGRCEDGLAGCVKGLDDDVLLLAEDRREADRSHRVEEDILAE